MTETQDTAIQLSGVSKTFKLPHEKHNSLKSLFVNMFRSRRTYEKQKVLRDISFEIKKGEFFGIVGRNGSGKSTLLKLLAGIYAPDSGQIQVNGKLTPFIELGVGFNPELTGRENVFLNGALLGFNRKEMAAMYDEIVEFAELEKFMDQKLKNYSSGMQVRLAFSIAIKAKNDLLIFDEVLAVGDEAFQRKCLNVFEEYKAKGQTIVLVTHDMETVRRFCNRALLLNEGKIIEIGEPRIVADKYSRLNWENTDKIVEQSNSRLAGAKFLRVGILNEKREKKQTFELGEKVIFDISWKGAPSEIIESVGINIFKQSGEHLTGINSRAGKHSKNWKEKEHISIEFNLNIQPGIYYILAEIFQKDGEVLDALYQGPRFSVRNEKMTWSGLVELPHKWRE